MPARNDSRVRQGDGGLTGRLDGGSTTGLREEVSYRPSPRLDLARTVRRRSIPRSGEVDAVGAHTDVEFLFDREVLIGRSYLGPARGHGRHKSSRGNGQYLGIRRRPSGLARHIALAAVRTEGAGGQLQRLAQAGKYNAGGMVTQRQGGAGCRLARSLRTSRNRQKNTRNQTYCQCVPSQGHQGSPHRTIKMPDSGTRPPLRTCR